MTGKKTKYIIIAITLPVLVSALILIFKSIDNPLSEKNFSSSEVTVGSVSRVIEATGETASENEVLILSPNAGIVNRVLRLPGSMVSEGEVVLTLDDAEIRDQLELTNDELDILHNNLQKLQLQAKTIRIDLEHDLEVKKLKIASLKAELEDQLELLDVGGISQAKIDKTKQELVLAEKELQISSQKNTIKLRQLEADEEGIKLQISIKEKQASQKSKQIYRNIVRSPATGIILEVRAREGENKQKNELLVRISEHTRLKIKGKVSEKHHDKVRNGGKVYTEVEGKKIPGVIGNINPVLEEGNIQFDVFLDNPQNENLKINQAVKLFLVVEEKSNVLRVKKGDYFKTSRSNCHVIKGSDIVTREIITGLEGEEFIEIIHGLDSGEVVINSNSNRSRIRKYEISNAAN